MSIHPVLELKALSKSFGGLRAVRGVDLAVLPGDRKAVIGPNGAGKTTLFNLITGHLRPDAGRVLFRGQDVTGIAPHDLCRLGMGRSFQRTNIFPRLTVYQNVQAAFLSHRGRGWNLLTPVGALYRADTEALLESIGLVGQAGEVSGFLSHGDQKFGPWPRWIRKAACTFSSTVSLGKMLVRWNERPMPRPQMRCGGTPVMSRPSTTTLPAVGRK